MSKHFILLLPFLFLARFAIAQHDLAMLEDKLASAQDDTARSDACDDIAGLYYDNGQPDSAVHFYRQSLLFAKKANDKYRVAKAHKGIGNACLYIPAADSAEWHYKKALQLAEGETSPPFQRLETLVLVNLGINYGVNQGQLDLELEHYLQGLEQARACSYGEMVTDALWRIGSVYLEQGNVQKAYETAQEGLAEAQRLGNTESILEMERLVAIVIGQRESSPEELRLGLKYLHDCLGFCIANKQQMDQVYVYLDLASLYGHSGQPDSALLFARQGYELSQQITIGHAEVNAATAYGQALLAAGKPSKAIEVLRRAEADYLPQSAVSSKVTMYDLMAKAYEKKGDYKNAFASSQALVNAMDSASTILNNEKILAMQGRFGMEQKERENQLLQKENQLVSTRSKLYGIIGLLLSAVCVAGAFLFFKLRKNKRELERLNASKNQLFAILAHDLKGPALSFDKLAQQVSFLLKKNEPERLLELAGHFEESGRQVKYILNNLLDWALSLRDQFDLQPEVLEMAPLIRQVAKGQRYLSGPKSITVRLSLQEGLTCHCDKNSFLILVRNLLNNAIKYSAPGGIVEVNTFYDGDAPVVEVKDEGTGMNGEQVECILTGACFQSQPGTDGEKGNGLGLQTCLKLLEQNLGSLDIESSTGVGTAFRLRFPSEHHAPEKKMRRRFSAGASL